MESIWFRSCPIEHKEALAQNIKADIAVIGAGMTGILTAYKLQKTGKSVVVLEANRIASGQTGKTTAKITSQHGLLYYRMILDLGEEKARQYAQANEKAIEAYRSLIQEEKSTVILKRSMLMYILKTPKYWKKRPFPPKNWGFLLHLSQLPAFPLPQPAPSNFKTRRSSIRSN